MRQFDIDLDRAMALCEEFYGDYTSFSRIYTFTNENISEYIKFFDLENRSLLTVGSSFDQVLNAYFCGARDITLLDINPFAIYYAYLKIAAILTLTYDEFQDFFFRCDRNNDNNKKMFSRELFAKISGVLKELHYDSYLFFDIIFRYYSPKVIRMAIFDDDEYRNVIIRGNNLYLKNEENYNYLKQIILDLHFKYVHSDIFKEPIEGEYDNIWLSNLCTTIHIDELKKLMDRINKDNLKIHGSVLFAYLWKTNFASQKMDDDMLDIYKIPLTRQIFQQYISEYHQIDNVDKYLFENRTDTDLVLIYRKKER